MIKDTGRPEKIFCIGWKVKLDQARHEVLTTDFLLQYPDADILRGWYTNRTIRADAEMELHGNKFFVELDTGSMSYRQIQKRQRVYRSVEKDFLLYVTLSERRLKGLVKHSEAVAGIALFTTLERAMAEPHGEIWIDYSGESVAMPCG